MNKKESITRLKKEGKRPIQISKELNIPISTVRYYYNDEARLKHIEHVKLMQKERPQKRNKKNRKKYQREYHNRKYKEDKEYREKCKEANRLNQRKYYALKKQNKGGKIKNGR